MYVDIVYYGLTVYRPGQVSDPVFFWKSDLIFVFFKSVDKIPWFKKMHSCGHY